VILIGNCLFIPQKWHVIRIRVPKPSCRVVVGRCAVIAIPVQRKDEHECDQTNAELQKLGSLKNCREVPLAERVALSPAAMS
jgi:hypothetical protein